ncbi:hypothetical protein R1flu_023408 [Riccia fluitans]|uniref:NADH dehydrogenase [ubiquinone] 1 beta subcomplex subunit 7 n=1 Tax=Riccia fluitans TaxID=41844 RepID=A0ABD1XUY1_9MARC
MGGKEMKATQEEMVKERVPLGYRDFCAHLLIPLNRCRRETFYLPWKCEDQRHSYEKAARHRVISLSDAEQTLLHTFESEKGARTIMLQRELTLEVVIDLTAKAIKLVSTLSLTRL